ncbi:SNF2 family N-terminal domain-containing protein, partial [Pyronema domesticum]
TNWEEQISRHVLPDSLKYLVYHGSNRIRDWRYLFQYDIILTTYSVVTLEWKEEQDPLHSLDFFRVILDEAHNIRNEKTKRSQSICALSAERRWAVSGTPIQNDLCDIVTLFKFLRYEPLHELNEFKRHILNGRESGMDNLRSALKAICLRRTKEILVGFPKRTENIHILDFTPSERQLYQKHKRILSKTHYSERSGSGMAKALRCLLNLRMICDHGSDLISSSKSQA